MSGYVRRVSKCGMGELTVKGKLDKQDDADFETDNV
jgi:hypothetical protein